MEKQELSYSKRRNIFEHEKKMLCAIVKVIELCVGFKDRKMVELYIIILQAIVESLRLNGCIDESSDNTVYYYTFKIVNNYAVGNYLAVNLCLNQLEGFIQSEDFGNDDGC